VVRVFILSESQNNLGWKEPSRRSHLV